jgi:hypothetical protein
MRLEALDEDPKVSAIIAQDTIITEQVVDMSIQAEHLHRRNLVY